MLISWPHHQIIHNNSIFHINLLFYTDQGVYKNDFLFENVYDKIWKIVCIFILFRVLLWKKTYAGDYISYFIKSCSLFNPPDTFIRLHLRICFFTTRFSNLTTFLNSTRIALDDTKIALYCTIHHKKILKYDYLSLLGEE